MIDFNCKQEFRFIPVDSCQMETKPLLSITEINTMKKIDVWWDILNDKLLHPFFLCIIPI